MVALPTSILSHWNHRFDGMDMSSNEFYGSVTDLLNGQHLGDIKMDRVNLSQGGLFSSKREYLQVKRKEHVFHICAAPFGNGFFVSWWLGELESGVWAMLTRIPYLGVLFGLIHNVARPMTYYRMDTALMFQSVTHAAVLESLDKVTEAKGLRALSELERRPTMKDFWAGR